MKGCTHRARIGEHASSGDVWMGGAYAQVVKILIRGGGASERGAPVLVLVPEAAAASKQRGSMRQARRIVR